MNLKKILILYILINIFNSYNAQIETSQNIVYQEDNDSFMLNDIEFVPVESFNNKKLNLIEEKNDEEEHDKDDEQDDEDNSHSKSSSHHSTKYGPNQVEFYIFICLALVSSVGAGLCSGLTVGLLSIDMTNLEIKMRNGSNQEKQMASKIMPVLQKHHWLLCTLLIGNAICVETLPIFIESTLPGYLAIIISTVVVVIICEIIPQAYCTGPKQLEIAEKCIPIVKFLMYLFGILAYPLARLLDKWLGEHHVNRFTRMDLKAVIQLHVQDKKNANHDHSHGQVIDGITEDQNLIIKQALDLSQKKISEVMLSYNNCFCISSNEIIDQNLIDKLVSKGYSRVPVYKNLDKMNIIGLLKTKNMVDSLYNNQGQKIEDVYPLKCPLIVSKDTTLLEMLMIFEQKRETMAIIHDENKKEQFQSQQNQYYSKVDLIYQDNQKIIPLGIIVLKDIFEFLINVDSLDNDKHN